MNAENKEFIDIIDQIEAAIFQGTIKYSDFIERNTYLNGRRFSFRDHEYQKYVCDLIENNPGCEFSITKCSQVGLSEICNRIILARMAMKAGTGCILSYPTKGASSQTLKMRFDPILDESPTLKALLDRDVNNSATKRFVNGSALYALSGNPLPNNRQLQLLSLPCSTILVDEASRQDDDITTGYHSRLTHAGSDTMIINISTPTVEGVGISAKIDLAGEIHATRVKCQKCRHVFNPDYFTDIKIPGYDEPNLEKLTRKDVTDPQIAEAYLRCPKCERPIHDRKVVWEVTKFPEKDTKHIGVELTPFMAPYITVQSLVRSHLLMTNPDEFRQQKLGLTATKESSQIVAEDIVFIEKPEELKGTRVGGLDVGKICSYISGIVTDDGFVIDQIESIKLGMVEGFIDAQFKNRKIAAIVADASPAHDLIYRLVGKHQRFYSADYITTTNTASDLSYFTMVEKDKYGELVRLLHANKGLCMDYIFYNLEKFQFVKSAYDDIIKTHFCSMRRVIDYSKEENLYTWIKSKDGNDHFFHSAVYFFLASKVAQSIHQIDTALPFVFKKIRGQSERKTVNLL